MDPAFCDDKSGNDLEFCINRDRGFQEMFSEFTGSFGEVVAAITAGETR